MRTRVVSLLILGVLAGMGSSCRSIRHANEPTHIIANVPFHENRYDDCGPASLAMVLGYWSYDIPVAEIHAHIYSPGARGTLTTDMEWFARREGFDARIQRGTIVQLIEYLNRDIPVVIMVDFSPTLPQANHYKVVIGYGERHFVAHSGISPAKRISEKRLERLWRRNDGWMLVVTPPVEHALLR